MKATIYLQSRSWSKQKKELVLLDPGARQGGTNGLLILETGKDHNRKKPKVQCGRGKWMRAALNWSLGRHEDSPTYWRERSALFPRDL